MYARNKIHSFVMEGRVSLDTLAASKERKLSTYTLQNVCSTLNGLLICFCLAPSAYSTSKLCLGGWES